KLNEKETSGTEGQGEQEFTQMMAAEPRPVPANNTGPAPGDAAPSTLQRPGANHKAADATGVVAAEFRVDDEHGGLKPLAGPTAPPKDSAPKERATSAAAAVNVPNEPSAPPLITRPADSSPIVNSTPTPGTPGPPAGSS